MKAVKPMFKLIWQTSLPDDDALLRVDVVSSGHGSTRVLLRPREAKTIPFSGEGPVFFRARLPSGTLFQQIVNDIQTRKLHRIVVKEAVPPQSYSLKWHAILGTLGQPESPLTGQPKPKTGEAKPEPDRAKAAPAKGGRASSKWRIVAREVIFHEKPKAGKHKPVQKSPVKIFAAKKSPAKFMLARPSVIKARTQVRRDVKLREAAVRIWTYLGDHPSFGPPFRRPDPADGAAPPRAGTLQAGLSFPFRRAAPGHEDSGVGPLFRRSREHRFQVYSR